MISPPRSRWRQPLTPPRLDLSLQDRFSPGQRRAVGATEVIAQFIGVTAAILRHGLRDLTTPLSYELGGLVVLSLVTLTSMIVLRDRASLTRDSFRQRYRFRFTLCTIWIAICGAILLFGPTLLGLPAGTTRFSAILAWSDIVILLRAAAATIGATRGVTAGTFSPAMLLIGTFAILITVGTMLLMLPKCRATDAPELPFFDRLRIAAFTSTSASCVTGLIVVPTGGEDRYWSRAGQTVILCLIQVGGLGIMTCGAFFALSGSRTLGLRESMTLRELFDPDQPVSVRRLLLSIIAFTLGSELVGAVLLSGLWSDKSFGEQAYFSVFHAVSAFCNAGFDLTGQSMMGMGHRWQVWGVVAGLIIVGGLGFGTLYSLATVGLARLRRRRPGLLRDQRFALEQIVATDRPARLTITTRLVVITTLLLLLIGTIGTFFFEAGEGGTLEDAPFSERLANAWFHSVITRTAGFNTIDNGDLRPATMMLTIVLMFIGAAPVSTGGGVKVTSAAVAFLAIVAIMRGRPKTEAFGRSVPDEIVKRALTIIAIGVSTLFAVTLLLSAFENDAQIPTIDLMYEAASACGTVGISTGITARLSPQSQVVLMMAMFLGRVGPLTLLLGLAVQRQNSDYDLPEERVTLG